MLRSATIILSLATIGLSVYALVPSSPQPVEAPAAISTPEDAWATCVRIMVEGGMASEASETCDLLRETP